MAGASAARGAGGWTWVRLLRIVALAAMLLLSIDLALRAREDDLSLGASAGGLRNRDGATSAEACERMLFESPRDELARAIVFLGSSVTYGANLGASEALPAQLAGLWRSAGNDRAVLNCAQEGGRPESALPVAAALGSHPVALVLMELMVPVYAERPQRPPPPWSETEVALLEASPPDARARLEAVGHWPGRRARIEARLAGFVRHHWRLYRIRGDLWIDDDRAPDQLAWTLRRMAAAAGVLPKRFHGQTTNIGKLPWRKAYVGGQRPSLIQHFRVPTARVSEADYAALLLLRDLLRDADVPLLFYEIPINLPFQREFSLMSEEELARLETVRTLLLERMAKDGLPVLVAPSMPDDGFLDKAHLTAEGALRLARHLRGPVEAAVDASGAADPNAGF